MSLSYAGLPGRLRGSQEAVEQNVSGSVFRLWRAVRQTGMTAAQARVQAAYYLVTGLWPLLHRRSFESLTGPKVDFWLVRTVGVVVAAIGAGLAFGARGDVSRDLEVTAVLTATGLGAIDVVEVARGRISRVYLADAVMEAALITVWAARRGRRSA